ncbi:hypothetical protein [Mesorhizobium sp. Z1-4]|nr:hypothetical protein [Mesorhizobium sp. Z1-4]
MRERTDPLHQIIADIANDAAKMIVWFGVCGALGFIIYGIGG